MYKPISDILKNETDIISRTPLSGNQELDNCLEGLNPGELILVTGTVGLARTVFVDNLIFQLSSHQREILIFENEINEVRLRKNFLRQTDISAIGDLPIYYNQDVVFLDEIEKSMIEFLKKNWNSIIVISPLQSLFLNNKILEINREEELIRVIFNLKRLAIKHKVPIIIKSYMNPNQNLDYTNSAWINDIKNLGNATEVLDKKIFIHWPGYADKNLSFEKKNTMQISIYAGARNNHGNFDLAFDYQKYKVLFQQ